MMEHGINLVLHHFYEKTMSDEQKIKNVERILNEISELSKEEIHTIYLGMTQLVANRYPTEMRGILKQAIIEGTLNQTSEFDTVSLFFGVLFAEVRAELMEVPPSESAVKELMEDIFSSNNMTRMNMSNDDDYLN